MEVQHQRWGAPLRSLSRLFSVSRPLKSLFPGGDEFNRALHPGPGLPLEELLGVH